MQDDCEIFDLKATDTFVEGRYSHLRRDRLRQGKITLIRGNPQHVENLIELLGMEKAKASPTPSLTETDPGDDPPIIEEAAAIYRRAVGILLYLSADRWDVKRHRAGGEAPEGPEGVRLEGDRGAREVPEGPSVLGPRASRRSRGR